jgi:hypothetical protein
MAKIIISRGGGAATSPFFLALFLKGSTFSLADKSANSSRSNLEKAKF